MNTTHTPTHPSAATPSSGLTLPSSAHTTIGVARDPHATPTHPSTDAIALAALAAALVLGCAVWMLVRSLALEPRWAGAMAYSLREASHRASATWEEFTDWVKLGH